MTFLLTGFRHDANVRQFAFEAVGPGKARHAFTVGVDLSVARKCRVPLQDLPRLCCGVLENRTDGDPVTVFTLTEEQVQNYADTCAAAKARASHRKPAHRRPATAMGQAWRGTKPSGME
jgi:hypothetical protein